MKFRRPVETGSQVNGHPVEVTHLIPHFGIEPDGLLFHHIPARLCSLSGNLVEFRHGRIPGGHLTVVGNVAGGPDHAHAAAVFLAVGIHSVFVHEITVAGLHPFFQTDFSPHRLHLLHGGLHLKHRVLTFHLFIQIIVGTADKLAESGSFQVILGCAALFGLAFLTEICNFGGRILGGIVFQDKLHGYTEVFEILANGLSVRFLPFLRQSSIPHKTCCAVRL